MLSTFQYFATPNGTRSICRVLSFGILVLGLTPNLSAEVRIKDITTVEGVRVNQLTGMGLVTGLNGTGGTSPITREFASNMVQRFGIRNSPFRRLAVGDDTKQRTDNVSVVTVTAQLPIFSKEGSTIDVSIAAFDDAESLQGGNLMTTPMYGVDGSVYAVASGALSIGGFAFGGDAATVQKNHPTAGRISSGATVEKVVPFEFGSTGQFRLLLRNTDFVNAHRVAATINEFYPGVASTVDGATIKVLVPLEYASNPVPFLGWVRSLDVQPDATAKVVINERTGTVVVGEYVRISPVAITHANLSVVTTESPEVSQPAPFSDGVTAIVPRTELGVVEGQDRIHVVPATTTVNDLARALNTLGVTPRDLSAIFQQLRAVGALHADLEFQ